MYVHTYIHTYICTQQATALWAVLLCNVCALLSKAIVFVVGGGNYIEYLNLQDYAKVQSHAVKAHWTKRKWFSSLPRTPTPTPFPSSVLDSCNVMFSLPFGTHPLQRSQPVKRIVYGSSDLVSAKEFLQQVRGLVCMYICTGTCGASPAFLQQSPPLGVLQSFSCFLLYSCQGWERNLSDWTYRLSRDKFLTVLLYWNIENSTHKVLSTVLVTKWYISTSIIISGGLQSLGIAVIQC